jgi:4-hydroxy-tetrahydrodipicolinate synthase
MATHSIPQPLKGIVVPLVTPLAARDQLDLPGLERLIEHVISGGVHGLFLLGTCGEGPSLSHPLRREFIGQVCRQVQGRVPVLVGIADTSYSESVELAKHAAEIGADALVVAPPYYYPVEQFELTSYIEWLVREISLPLMLYNMPSLTNVVFEPATVGRLMDQPGIIGFKDSSGDLAYFQTIRELTRRRPDWTLLVGPEHLLARSIELGGDGGVSGGANIWPQLFVAIFEAATAQDKARVGSLVEKADALGQIYQIGGLSASSVVRGLKAALSVLGICSDRVAEPLEGVSPSDRQTIEQVLHTLGLGGGSPALS